jgi:hypothetical protein
MTPQTDRSTLLDRHNVAITQIFARFLNMAVAATEPMPKDITIEQANLNAMAMETETAALVRMDPSLTFPFPHTSHLGPTFYHPADKTLQITEIQNLLTINREIKALWIGGPLRKPGEGEERDAEIDKKAAVVQDLFNQVMAMKEKQTKARALARANGTAKEEDGTAEVGAAAGGDV